MRKSRKSEIKRVTKLKQCIARSVFKGLIALDIPQSAANFSAYLPVQIVFTVAAHNSPPDLAANSLNWATLDITSIWAMSCLYLINDCYVGLSVLRHRALYNRFPRACYNANGGVAGEVTHGVHRTGNSYAIALPRKCTHTAHTIFQGAVETLRLTERSGEKSDRLSV